MWNFNQITISVVIAAFFNFLSATQNKFTVLRPSITSLNALGDENYELDTYDLMGKLRDGGSGSGYGYGGGGLYNSVPLLLASAIGQARPAAAPAPSAAVPMSDGEFLGSGGSPPKQLPAAAPAPAHYTPPISTLMLMSMMPMHGGYGYGGGSGEWDGD